MCFAITDANVAGWMQEEGWRTGSRGLTSLLWWVQVKVNGACD